ncbi:Retrovirus-related Pol polyprotein from transposon 17.6 [Labeo rohita]|uniref:ribonuclease H n=1 Tax=Labeo rohita TaxID=84645 RepID=A0ABQ8LEK7_LABRO|nr:Retrovirus-related Pol polyprotein from transposon 17.6 [Labeo rohita]
MSKALKKEKHKSKPRYKPCVPPCSRFIPSGDTHSLCVVCLGADHTESALRREPSPAFLAGLAPLPPRRSGSCTPGVRSWIYWREWRRVNPYLLPHLVDPGPVLRDRKPVLRFLPPREQPQRFSFLPLRRLNLKLLEVVTRAVAKLNIDWPAEKQAEPQRSKLDERFLCNRPPPSHRSLPFFPDLHTEVSRSWGKPFSARLFVPASDYYGNVVGTTERGYRAIPRVEQTLASYLSPEVASSLKAPVLPTKALRTTSVLVGKGYSAAGQAGSCLHTMVVLQAYQADLLKEDRPCIGRSMAAMVAAERHLWLTLSDMKEKDRVFLLDAPLVPSGLFGDAVNSVVDRYQEARKQAAAFQRFLLRRVLTLGAAGWEQPQPSTSSSHRASQKQSVASRAPPQRDQDQRRSKPGTSKPRPDLRVVLQAKKSSTKRSCTTGCAGPLRAAPAGEGRVAPHSTVSVSPQCPQETIMRTLPVFQDAVVSGELITRVWKEAIEVVPPHDRESGFYSRYFIVPKKDGGLRPILSETAEPLSHAAEVQNVDSQKFLRFAFRGKAYQYRVLPFGLALSPRTFTKCVDAALAPLRLRGIRILNYIDDWLILAQSEHMAVQHRDVVLAHMKELGLRLNAKKKDHLSRRGVGFDHDAGTFVTCSDRVDPHCSHESERRPVTHCKAVPATAGSDGSCVQRDTFWPAVHETPTVVAQDQGVLPERGNPFRMIKVTRRCLRALDMWKKPWFLSQGPVLGAPCRRVTLATDASLTGWGAIMSGHSARGLWSGRHLTWHINCLEMLAMFQALKHFLPDLIGRHVLVRTDNIAVVYYINHQGGLRSRPLYKLAHQILVWSQDKLLSLKAVHVPVHLNTGADILSRQGPRPGGMDASPRGGEADLESFWPGSGGPLRYSGECAMSPLVLSDSSSSPGAGCHGTDVAEASSVRLSPDRSAPGSSGESAPGRGVPSSSSPVLAGPSLVLGPDFSPRRRSMGDSRQEGSPLSGGGPPPSPGVVEVMGVAPEGAHLVASGLSTEVVETILQSRAPSTRKLYTLKWKLFTSWCGDHQQDPVNCPVGTVLEFLQDRLSAGLAHSTLKVYVAAIAAYHAPLGGMSVGKDPLVVPMRFHRGGNVSSTVETHRCVEAEASSTTSGPYVGPRRALTSLKRVGDLQALSVAPSHLDFAPGMAKAFLYPRPGYIPKVPSAAPRAVVLQAFCPPPFRDSDQQKLNSLGSTITPA